MASRLLTRLDASIAAASTPTKADCLRAERAGLLARLGRLGDARAALSSLQMQYSSHPHPMVSPWLCLADGLLSYYSDMGPEAHDRVRRAHALSKSMRDNNLHALSAAWLAFMDYGNGDMKSLASHAAEALELASPDHHAARARASMAFALAYHMCDRYDLAQPWYTLARHHGLAEGDEATLSALGHNYAGMNANLARQKSLEGPEQSQLVRQALLANDSTSNLDAMVGSAALAETAFVQRAQIFCLMGRWEEAIALYDKHIVKSVELGLARMECAMRADMAWCHLQLGHTEQASREARLAADATALERCDLDDRAAAHSRLSQVYGQLGEADLAEQHGQRATEDWAAHARHVANIFAWCNQALKIEPPKA